MPMPINLGSKVAAKMLSAPRRVIRIPFSQNSSEYLTGVKLQAGCVVEDCRVHVITNVASSTIDVGFDSASLHNDPDGLIDGLSCANAGWPAVVDTAETASKMGPMLQGGVDGGSAVAANEGGPNSLLIREEAEVSYTTSAHAIAGYIYLVVTVLEELPTT